MTPEQEARKKIEEMLGDAGWDVCDVKDANIYGQRGVAIREFPLKPGYGFADYLLYVDGKAAGIIEAKKTGTTLTGVETQSVKYSQGLPENLPAWYRPLPFTYESTGIETRLTNGLDPEPCSRQVFSFHRPETLGDWLGRVDYDKAAEGAADYGKTGLTLRDRLRKMPPLIEEGLWPAQIKAIKNLEISLAENHPRALIQMATGSGKTFTAVTEVYRLLRFGEAKRVLFLVDRGNLARQTLKEFQQYESPYNNFKFTEEYIVQQLQSNKIDKTARVCITTIQRLYSMLKGEELPLEAEEESIFDHSDMFKEPPPIEYNPAIPIETFDVIITDECHRSIYNLWRQVLEYFDSFLIGLTATPNKQTFGFFNQNLVMEYPHEQAVADGVNVNYDVYRIRTKITEKGSQVEAGHYVDKRDRDTRKVRWEQLDEALTYDAKQLDRDVVAKDQIRTVVRTFKERLFTEIFPGRTDVPKTLIFAKDDSHADDIVQQVREVFGKGNDFAQKITYRTTGKKPEDLISEFRNSYLPRIAVTVDMIATGTDIKPVEIVMFMRSVKSRSFFEQMKGRGVRIISDHDLQQVTPDAKSKTHFVIVDTVGVCEEDKTDSRPLERKRSVSLEKLLQAISLGNTEPDVISSVAGRFARLEKNLSTEQKKEIQKLGNGKSLKDITGELILSIDPDRHIERAKRNNPECIEPTAEQVKKAADETIREATRPLHDPALRNRIVELVRETEQVIDTVSTDKLIEAGFSLEDAKKAVTSFEQFIKDNKDEITALQIIYSRPYKARLRYEDIKALAEKIEKPPVLMKVDRLWEAYASLERSKVRGAGGQRTLTDLVSLVRFAIHQENELEPFAEHVHKRFRGWVGMQEAKGKRFSPEQLHWLEMIRDHVIANCSIDREDFDYSPFSKDGGIGKVHQLFGEELWPLLDELNEVLAA